MVTGIKVSLDGGLTYEDAREGVRIIYEGVDTQPDGAGAELHINVGPEGVIMDVWADDRGEPYNLGTSSATCGDLVEQLVDGQD